MKVHALIAMARARYTSLPDRQKPIALLFVGLFSILMLTLLLKGCVALAHHRNHRSYPPLMTREGNHIKIPEHSALRTQIKTQVIQTSALPHVIAVPGLVEAKPSRIVNILPPLTGRLIELKTMQGQAVKKNQELAVISSPDLAQAYSDYDAAKSVFKLTTEALNRAKKVNRAGGNSIKDIEVAQNNNTQALAELKRAEAKLKTLGNNNFSLLRITAPISGRVVTLNYGRGSYITDTSIPLLTISNIKSVWVTANVPEHFAGVVKEHQHVRVYLPAYPNETLDGHIDFVNSYLEADTRRNKTRIVFSNPLGKLQPNMFATVYVDVVQDNQIIIPISSILMNDDKTSVYVEVSPWVFECREIQLGNEDNDQVRVVSGLAVGERIATTGGIFIND